MSQWFSQLTVDQFTRSVRKPSFLLLLWSLDLVAMMVIVAYFTFPGFPSSPDLIAWAFTAGSTVLEHLEWGLGMGVTSLLAFYAVVLGAQFKGSPEREVQIRHGLGDVAILLTGAMAPPLVLGLVACAAYPVRLGALLVVIPFAILMAFLAVQLSSFVAITSPASAALEDARLKRDWASKRLRTLRVGSARAPVLVLCVNATVAIVAGMIPTIIVARGTDFTLQTTLVVLPTVFVEAVGLAALVAAHAVKSRAYRIMALALPVTITCVVLMTLVPFWSKSSMHAALVLGLLLSFCIIWVSLMCPKWPWLHRA